MTLEMYKKAALPLLHKQVNAGLDRLRKDRIAAPNEILLPNLVPSRMRKPHSFRGGGCQIVFADFVVFEDTELLALERIALDSVAVEYARMRRQARQYRRDCVVLCPIKNVSQGQPVRLTAQI